MDVEESIVVSREFLEQVDLLLNLVENGLAFWGNHSPMSNIDPAETETYMALSNVWNTTSDMFDPIADKHGI